MKLNELLENYSPGEPHTWLEEFDWLWSNHPGRMDLLCTLIQTQGITTPILLGGDGRVWDGHHRIAAAFTLGVEEVPVTYEDADD